MRFDLEHFHVEFVVYSKLPGRGNRYGLHVPGDDFGVIGFQPVVKRDVVFSVASGGDHVCAWSVPVRHVGRMGGYLKGFG